MSTRWSALAAILVASLCLGSVVAAAPPSPQAAAREHYDRGMQRYNLGDFDGAIVEFDAAYAVSKAPGLLFNLAQAHRLARHTARALELYRAYLQAVPRAENRRDAEALIAQLEAAPAEAVAPPPEPTPEPPAPPIVAPAPPVVAVTPPPRRNLRARGLFIGGVSTLLAGAAVLGAGIGLGVSARSLQRGIESAAATGAPWSASLQRDYDSGHSRAVTATALDAVGGVLVGAGAILTGLGVVRGGTRRFAFGAAPGGVEVAWTTEF